MHEDQHQLLEKKFKKGNKNFSIFVVKSVFRMKLKYLNLGKGSYYCKCYSSKVKILLVTFGGKHC